VDRVSYLEKLITFIEQKIKPFTLNEIGRAKIASLLQKHTYDLLIECVDIGYYQYIKLDESGQPTKESIEVFMDKIGGIAHNKTLSPVDKEIRHVLNAGKKAFNYWNENNAKNTLKDYVYQLQKGGWSDDQIEDDLKNEVIRAVNKSKNWSEWMNIMEGWIKDIQSWGIENNTKEIIQNESIIAESIFEDTPRYAQSLCKQINASYENNLFDCTTVMMRRLLEILLILAYQKAGIEQDIMDKNGAYHIVLDKIIKNAEQNQTLLLSRNTKKDMMLFKDLGNYSAHKIWYNCTQKDIEPHIQKFRAIIEELLYKSGLK
jgi:hypothetical protein